MGKEYAGTKALELKVRKRDARSWNWWRTCGRPGAGARGEHVHDQELELEVSMYATRSWSWR